MDVVTFFSNDIGVNSINLNNVNLYDDDFDNCDSETINHVRLIPWYKRQKQHCACKKMIDEELLPATWHPTRVWD